MQIDENPAEVGLEPLLEFFVGLEDPRQRPRPDSVDELLGPRRFYHRVEGLTVNGSGPAVSRVARPV